MQVHSDCDGCLGSRRCWVCLGYGLIEQRRESLRVCHRCFGSGRCPWCQELQVGDLGSPPELTP